MKPIVFGSADAIVNQTMITDMILIQRFDHHGVAASDIGITSFDVPILYTRNDLASPIWFTNEILFDRVKTSLKTGLEVSQVVLNCSVNKETNLIPTFIKDMVLGSYDNSVFYVYRTFLASVSWLRDASKGMYVAYDYTSPEWCGIQTFVGRIAEVEADGLGARVTINSAMELLNLMVPKNIFSPLCSRTLFQGGCPVPRDSNKWVGTVGPDTWKLTVVQVLMSWNPGDGYFDNGQIVLSDGQTATIKYWQGGAAFLNRALTSVPVHGTQVFMWPGCAKTRMDCTYKFNGSNGEYFRGFESVPAPEYAV